MHIREVWIDGYLIGCDVGTRIATYVMTRYNGMHLLPLDRKHWPEAAYFIAARLRLFG